MDTEIAKLSKFTFSEQKGGTMNTVNQIPYEYSNLPIPGGGYAKKSACPRQKNINFIKVL